MASLPDWAGLGERLLARLRSFLYILTHDTTGVDARAHLAWSYLGAWLVAGLVATPLTFLVARLMRGSVEFRKVAGIAFSVSFLQALFFALHWNIIGWGQRPLDWSVYGVSLLLTTLVAKWGLESSVVQAAVFVLAHSVLSMTMIFLALFVGTELGYTTF